MLMFFSKTLFMAIFSMLPAAKPMTSNLPHQAIHFMLGSIMPCKSQLLILRSPGQSLTTGS